MAAYDSNKFESHLETKWKDQPCPMCKVKSWGYADSTHELKEFAGGGLTVGMAIPVVPVFCSNCGYVALISAVSAGLVE